MELIAQLVDRALLGTLDVFKLSLIVFASQYLSILTLNPRPELLNLTLKTFDDDLLLLFQCCLSDFNLLECHLVDVKAFLFFMEVSDEVVHCDGRAGLRVDDLHWVSLSGHLPLENLRFRSIVVVDDRIAHIRYDIWTVRVSIIVVT